MSARSVLENALLDEMLDSTVLRSGLMDRFCVVLFEVGVVFFFGEPGSPPTFGEDPEGLFRAKTPIILCSPVACLDCREVKACKEHIRCPAVM